MKFRLSAQPPKPQQRLPKSIAPTHLLSDPAFSPDPHSNPYFVDDREPAWASAPPVGHPVLKQHQRRPLARFATDGVIASADFDFQLIQPPNSPVSYLGGTHDSPQYPFPNKAHTKDGSPVTTIPSAPSSSTAPSSLHTRTGLTSPSVLSPLPVPPQPLAAKEPKKRRMPFLSRRKTAQPAETFASQNTNPSFASASLPPAISNDVTQSRRPAAAPRITSEPNIPQAGERPGIAPRSITTGADTPRSTATTSTNSMGSKRHGEGFGGRVKELDKIDELDETNPWGIAMHHGGPYEAASRALKRTDARTPLGLSNGGFGEYYNQAMVAHGHAYIPPQAPVGVSLNLSPGQILPRNLHEKRGNPPPRMRDGSTLPPRMQAAHSQSNTLPTPSLYRSQSHVPSSQSSAYHSHSNRVESPPDVRPEPMQHRRQSQPPPASSFSSPYSNSHAVISTESRHNPQPDPYFRGQQSQGFSVPSPPKSQPEFRHEEQAHPSHSQGYPVASHPHPSNAGPESRANVQPEPQISRRPSNTAFSPSVASNSVTKLVHQPPVHVETAYQNPPSRDEGPKKSEREEEHGREEEEESDSDAPFDIGLAMLRSEPSETLSIPAPRVFLPSGVADHDLEFDPYDPVHLEKEHSRSPSPLVVLYVRSDRSYDTSQGPSRAPSIAHSHGSSSHESSRAPYREPSRALSQQSLVPPTQPTQLPISAPPQQPPFLPPRNPTRAISAGPPTPSLRVRNPEPSTTSQHEESYDHLKKDPLSVQHGGHPEDPPPYNAILAVEHVSRVLSQEVSNLRSQDRGQNFSRSASPKYAPSWKSNEIARSDDSHNPRRQGRPTAPNSTNNSTTSIPQQLQLALVLAPKASMHENRAMTDNRPNINQDAPPTPPMLPPRRSRERLQAPTRAPGSLDHEHERAQPPPSSLSLNHEPDRDARSMHPSISTYSSSQSRNGPPPPHRRVPKHLVMPAPLNNGPSSNQGNGMLAVASPPPRMNGTPLPPRMNAMGMASPPRTHYPPPSSLLAPRHASLQFQPQQQAQTYYPQPTSPPPSAKAPGFAPSAPRAQEIHVAAASRKLKKRASVMGPPSATKVPPAPMMTTVSFAPPVVGYGNLAADQKSVARSKTDKMPKRVLSKKRTDI